MANDESAGFTLRLSHDEALVLFDWLTREGQCGSIPFRHNAERQVHWNIEALLEKQLVEPFCSDYPERVMTAQKNIVSDCFDVDEGEH